MPHARRDLGLFVPEEHGLPDTMNRFEHWWTTPVQVILFFFGLTNAGVAFSTVGTGTWVVVSSLLVGKPVGIVLATYLAVTIGLRAPGGLGYRHTTVVGVVAGIGFTVSLFFSIAAFPAGQILNEVKMGALLSFVAAPLALVLALLTGVYRRQAGGRP
jgi:NhaA family Na+:H+ antiporter